MYKNSFKYCKSTRKDALSTLIRLFVKYQGHWFNDADTISELIQNCLNLLKKGDDDELICRLLTLCFITSSSSDSQDFISILSVFKSHLKNESIQEKPLFLFHIGLQSVLIDLNSDELLELLSLFKTCFTFQDSIVVLNALQGYGLVYSALKESMQPEISSESLDAHLVLLENQDLEIRMAAGENIALIFENASQESEYVYEKYPELLEMVQLLASDSTRFRSKSDRQVQKTLFRDILQTVESETTNPSILVTIAHQTIELDSWAKIKQWNALKSVLGEGIDSHFVENNKCIELFELDSLSFWKKGPSNLRLLDTTVGKERAKARKKERGGKRWTDLAAQEDE